MLLWRTFVPTDGSKNSAPAKPEEKAEADAPKSECDGVPTQTGVLKRILARRYIKMGVQEDAPPMNYVEQGDDDPKQTRRAGFDYELLSRVAAQMGLMGPEKVRVKEVDAYEKLPCLLKQKEGDEYSVDLIMSGITRDDELPDVDWSEPYYDFGYALIAKKESHIRSLNDCKSSKTRIGIVKGDSAVSEYVKGKLPRAEVVSLVDHDNWINAINLGEVDAVIYDFPYAVEEVKILNAEKKENGVTGQDLEIKKPFLEGSETQYCIGIPRGNPDLKERLDAAIKSVRDSPKYSELVNQYFKSTAVRAPDRPSDAEVYKVVRGDSLSEIAERELGDASRWPELADLNNVGNEHLIHPGQELIMPDDYKP